MIRVETVTIHPRVNYFLQKLLTKHVAGCGYMFPWRSEVVSVNKSLLHIRSHQCYKTCTLGNQLSTYIVGYNKLLPYTAK